jgi:DNA primase large subunit
VLKPETDIIQKFQPKDADPFKIDIRNFMPDAKEGEASELLREALDWNKTQNPEQEEQKNYEGKSFSSISLKTISEKNYPPSIKKILEGMKGDGRKRALFIITNFFRSVGMDRKDIEKILHDWNKKNETPLKEGYIVSQMIASFRGKSIPPPNYDKDYYKGIGIVPTEEELRYKNPSSFMIRKSLREEHEEKRVNERTSKDGKKRYTKDNFKNKL